jgi:hypothetical protein
MSITGVSCRLAHGYVKQRQVLASCLTRDLRSAQQSVEEGQLKVRFVGCHATSRTGRTPNATVREQRGLREERPAIVPGSAVAALGYALRIGAAPDEPAHIVRAAAVGVGGLEGRVVAPYQSGGASSRPRHALRLATSADQVDWRHEGSPA